MTILRSLAPAFLVAATLAAPIAALAQSAPPAAPSTTTSAAPAPMSGTAKADKTAQKASDRAERRITDLHKRLAITPAQEPAWQRFAAVMRENATHMSSEVAEHTDPTVGISAPDHLRTYARMAEAHAQEVNKLVPAFDTLYGSFSPEQKKTADQVFNSYAEHMRHGEHRHG